MRRFDRVVVVVPAHNEIDLLPRCLRALSRAAAGLPDRVVTVVVLDACDDGSQRLAGRCGPDVSFITVDAGNVGVTRAAGFAYARHRWGIDRTWYATTDADSAVSDTWLRRMVAVEADMVLGVVTVPVWRHVSADVADLYGREYASKGPGHNHIHGANMGFRADAYWSLGGFRALCSGEDVELVARFEDAGMDIRRDETLSVATSDRHAGRAPHGFAAYLRDLTRRTGTRA
jgi:glycosyltransferase involved in cell wall biosynthesis